MATSTPDLIAASRVLDPAGRALLNLWLHRGLDDAAIAELSGGSVQDVAQRRRDVVERLAAEVGATPEAVRSALDDLATAPATPLVPPPPPPLAPGERRRADRSRAAAPPRTVPAAVEPAAVPGGLILPGDPEEPPAAPEDIVVPGRTPEPAAVAPEELVVPGEPVEPAAAPEDLVLPGDAVEAPAAPADLVLPEAPAPRPDPEPEERPKRRREPARGSQFPATLALSIGIVIVGMVIVAELTGGTDPAPEPKAAPSPAAVTATGPQRLTPVPGGPDRVEGTMRVARGAVTFRLTGLDHPRDDYEVWLYNSAADARSLGRLSDRRLRLPKSARRFAYLDVSLEGDRDPDHSGRSVLRARLPRS